MNVGFLTDFFDPEARKRSRIASLSKKLQQKFGQTEDRIGAAEALASMRDPEAMAGLLRRFTVTVDNHTHDQDEKQHVSDLIVEEGPLAIEPLKDFLRREKEVSWALRTLRRLVEGTQWVDIVLETLGNRTSEDTDHEKLDQIIRELQNNKDPRVPKALARFLTDLDDSIRFAAVEALGTIDAEESRLPLLEAVVNPQEESQRVRGRILEVFKDRGWEVKGYRKAIEERLPEGWYLDRSGHIKALKVGEEPPDAGEGDDAT